ncbi:hypothetical protein SO802_010891 [Lithocarpus litseifolius]|uniref:Uncharacterized protein n=1 Tax=Lithocarpus litseifolius TaxID=425828 RepID=A0AAW2DGQ5_9ROSI
MRVEQMTKMRVERTGAERWMDYHKLPDSFRVRVRRYQQYKWKLTRGVKEENILDSLPKDLRRDIERHICLHLLKRRLLWEARQYLNLTILIIVVVLSLALGIKTEVVLDAHNGVISTMKLGANWVDMHLLELMYVFYGFQPLKIANFIVVEFEAFALKADDLKFMASRFVASQNTSRQGLKPCLSTF